MPCLCESPQWSDPCAQRGFIRAHIWTHVVLYRKIVENVQYCLLPLHVVRKIGSLHFLLRFQQDLTSLLATALSPISPRRARHSSAWQPSACSTVRSETGQFDKGPAFRLIRRLLPARKNTLFLETHLRPGGLRHPYTNSRSPYTIFRATGRQYTSSAAPFSTASVLPFDSLRSTRTHISPVSCTIERRSYVWSGVEAG